MDVKVLSDIMGECKEDYEVNGRGKDAREWLAEALVRQVGVLPVNAPGLADEILDGIARYRERKSIISSSHDNMVLQAAGLGAADISRMKDDTRCVARAVVADVEASKTGRGVA